MGTSKFIFRLPGQQDFEHGVHVERQLPDIKVVIRFFLVAHAGNGDDASFFLHRDAQVTQDWKMPFRVSFFADVIRIVVMDNSLAFPDTVGPDSCLGQGIMHGPGCGALFRDHFRPGIELETFSIFSKKMQIAHLALCEPDSFFQGKFDEFGFGVPFVAAEGEESLKSFLVQPQGFFNVFASFDNLEQCGIRGFQVVCPFKNKVFQVLPIFLQFVLGLVFGLDFFIEVFKGLGGIFAKIVCQQKQNEKDDEHDQQGARQQEAVLLMQRVYQGCGIVKCQDFSDRHIAGVVEREYPETEFAIGHGGFCNGKFS
ncbi:MAG: hypothetical protein ACD_75C01272G0001 [uncultured bacterium]|nr:MAG: hypothetical protein ACD_75C01272G0001 [uncultured bacterium]